MKPLLKSFASDRTLVGVAIAIMIAVPTAWLIAFSPTIQEVKRYIWLSRNLPQAQVDEVTAVEPIIHRIHSLDPFFGKQNTKAEDIRQIILDSINQLTESHPVTITSIPPMNSYNDNGFSVYINSITIVGRFDELLRILFALEENCNSGKIISCTFTKFKNPSGSYSQLFLNMHFQTILKDESEKINH